MILHLQFLGRCLKLTKMFKFVNKSFSTLNFFLINITKIHRKTARLEYNTNYLCIFFSLEFVRKIWKSLIAIVTILLLNCQKCWYWKSCTITVPKKPALKYEKYLEINKKKLWIQNHYLTHLSFLWTRGRLKLARYS